MDHQQVTAFLAKQAARTPASHITPEELTEFKSVLEFVATHPDVNLLKDTVAARAAFWWDEALQSAIEAAFECLPDRLRSDVLLQSLGDPSPGVRASAALLCARYPIAQSDPLLQALLKDQDRGCRQCAARAVGATGKIALLDDLVAGAKDGIGDYRDDVSTLLQKAGLEGVLAAVRRDNSELQMQALVDLEALSLTPADRAKLLTVCRERYPNDAVRGEKPVGHAQLIVHACLLGAALKDAPDSVLRQVESIYQDVITFQDAREKILTALLSDASEESGRAFLRLLALPCSRDVDLRLIRGTVWSPWEGRGLRILKRLFDLAPNLDDRAELYEEVLSLMEHKLLDLHDHPKFLAHLLSQAEMLVSGQGERLNQFAGCFDGTMGIGGGRVPQDVVAAYNELNALLELLRLADEVPVALYYQALAMRSLRIRVYAVLGLLAQGEPVNEHAVEELAAAPVVRAWLWNQLNDMGHARLFPKRFATQDALAESDMVGWLMQPLRECAAPQKIEFIGKTRAGTEDGALQGILYVYRYLPPKDGGPNAKESGKERPWQVAVAGPYDLRKAPTPDGRFTGTAYEDLNTDKLDEQIQACLDYVRNYVGGSRCVAEPIRKL